MPLQKPSSASISRSKRVRCSMRWASTSLLLDWKNSSRSASSALMFSTAFSTTSRAVT
jgi:hypothetical protein